jgi:hypothetical protein
MSKERQNVETVALWLKGFRHVVAFTGAGSSPGFLVRIALDDGGTSLQGRMPIFTSPASSIRVTGSGRDDAYDVKNKPRQD